MSIFQSVRGGVARRAGEYARSGQLLKARNCRYIPGDAERLWTLLGRSKFNATQIPAAAIPLSDDATVKSIFPYAPDGGTPLLVVHKGGSLFEAAVGASGAFAEVKVIAALEGSRGGAFGYRDKVYYACGADGLDADRSFWTRDPAGWVKGGHRKPLAAMTATNQGAATFTSTTDIVYGYRLYDNTTGTESQISDLVSKVAFTNLASVRLAWAAGVTTGGERGTHVRIYRSLLGEPAGLLYRIDGNGDGLPLASFVAGFTWDDSTTNVNSQIYGLVEADGQEGSGEWAEFGGAPPMARGGTIFQDVAVLWGIPDRLDQVIYSALTLPECFPVDIDGIYQYYLTFSSAQQDVVQSCQKAGPYLLVLNRNSIFRVLSLPTYTDPGFNRKVQDTLSVEHGCIGPWAATSFGIDPDQEAQHCIYVSREHGPMLTNGVSDQPIVEQAGWNEFLNKAYAPGVVAKNYPTREECWIFFPGKSSAMNNQAIICDYSSLKTHGVRVTGPVDVRADDAALAWDQSGDPRLYLVASSSRYVFVQDSGSTDAQQNYDAAGNIPIEVEFPRERLGGDPFRTVKAQRLSVEGIAGAAFALAVSVVARDGSDTQQIDDTVTVGPGEGEDFATVQATGNSHKATISRAGPVGTTYDQDDANCALGIKGVRWEIGPSGTQRRTAG